MGLTHTAKMSSAKEEDKRKNEEENEKTTDAQGENIKIDYDKQTEKGEICVKVICLGDSAVGKSKYSTIPE